jgi:hypothetical protein
VIKRFTDDTAIDKVFVIYNEFKSGAAAARGYGATFAGSSSSFRQLEAGTRISL